jgi:hypothetical protein
MTQYQNLLARIRAVRRRWRMQSLVKGLAFFLISAIALLLLGIWGANVFGFKAAAVWIMRLVTGGSAAYVAVHFFVAPLRRRISDVQIAQYIEERYPDLEDRLITAVEFGDGRGISPGMLDLLIKDAMEKTSRIDFSVFLNRKRLAVYGLVGAVTFLALVALLNWGPPFFQYGFDKLYVQWTSAAPRTLLLIEVMPGDVQIAKGVDQQIKAQLLGFDSADVKLYTQPLASTAWAPVRMEPDRFGSSFLYLLTEVQSSMHYYVEARDVRSKIYTIKVVEAPRVDKIDITYKFPAYTGMADQTVEGDGDISALRGTRVTVNIHASLPVQTARLQFDDQSTIALTQSGDESFSGALTLNRSGSYVVQFSDAGGKPYTASQEFEMEALPDAPPKVTITRPMRDLRATSVEEVFSEVKAEDDIGLSKVELHYSVNGAPEKVVDLYNGEPREKVVTASHTFFLEDFGLRPGDLVSYYGRAIDNNNATGPGVGASDIYFIHVRPFDQRYIQSQQRGGNAGDGSGGAQGQQELSQQEKEIVSATFKLIRDKDTMDPKEYSDNLKSLSLIQSRLQTQTQGVLDRLQRRRALDVSQDWTQLGAYMKSAAEEMGKAAVHLGAGKPVDALPEEQKALQQLTRAESLFNEIQVSFENRSGRGGGSGSGARAEDLADLFDLEMNKLKNQYETVQRGEQQARDQQVDELMERLRELAQRQQQLNERNRLMGRPPGSSAASSAGSSQSQQLRNQLNGAQGTSASSGGSSAQSQQQLLSEAEQLQRQLQRLSRERSSPQLNQASNRLQQAIQQMRQALQNQQRNGQEASAQGTRALQQLQDAQRALAQGQQTDLAQGLEQAVQESRGALNEENRIRSGIERLAQGRQGADASAQEAQQQRQDLTERKTALADRVQNLQNRIEDLAQQARKTQPEANSKLNQAAGTIRDRRLPERIRSGNPLQAGENYDSTMRHEDFIQQGLQDVNRQLEAARNSLSQTQESRLQDALNRTQRLAEGLQSMQQRLQNSARGQQGQQQAGQQSQRGQQGQEQGQQGQQGQQAQQGGQGQQQAQGQRQGQQGQQVQGDARGARSLAGAPPFGDVRDTAGDARPPAGGLGQEALRQQQAELQQRTLDTQELRRLLDRNSSEAQSIEQVLQALQRITDARRYDSPEGIASLKRAIDLLHQVELDLSRDLSRALENDKYFYADDNGVPASYKKLVEEYYKALAKIKR